MAPPPPASLPLQQRLLQLAQTLQFAWFVGHVTLLLSASRYFLSYVTLKYYSRMAQFTYRTAFLSAAATYGIVVYKAYRARARSGKQGAVTSLAGDENVQYLAMALVWFFSRQIALALLPFTVYSVFHVATYTRTNLIPTVQPQPAGPASQSGAESVASPTGKTRQQSPMAESIGRFVKEYYDSSMLLVAILEVALWFRLLLPCLLLSRSAITLWVLYSVFLRTRYSQSTFVQNTFQQLGARIDGFAANQSNPPAVRQTWDTAKAFLHQAVEVTDINKYVGGRPVHSQTGPKKAQ